MAGTEYGCGVVGDFKFQLRSLIVFKLKNDENLCCCTIALSIYLVIGHSAGLVETIDPFIEYRLIIIIIGTSSKQQDKKYPKRTNNFNYYDIPFILKIDNYFYTKKP